MAKMQPDDPAYWMLEQGRRDFSKRSVRVVHKDGCYICEDPEYALMGLPLCRKCPKCSGHIAADHTICDDCGYDEMDGLCPKCGSTDYCINEHGTQVSPPPADCPVWEVCQGGIQRKEGVS